MRHLIPISGKDSAATAIVQTTRRPDLDYEFFFNPTGAELPEVFAWIDKVGAFLGKPVLHIGDDLESIIYEQGILPSIHKRFCTRLAKIIPMEEYIGMDHAIVYYGIRADENRSGYKALSDNNITPAYPLQEMGLTLRHVWKLLEERDLLPPQFFWQQVYDMTVEALGPDAHLINDILEPWERAYLFAWRSRANCYWCFNQRRYELVGLYDHHPPLFAKAQDMEQTIGGKNYHWLRDFPLADIPAKAQHYREKRVRAIIKAIYKKRDHNILDDGEELNLLDATSCGVFCGK